MVLAADRAQCVVDVSSPALRRFSPVNTEQSLEVLGREG